MKTYTDAQLAKIIKKNKFALVDSKFGDVNDSGNPTCGCLLTHLYCATNGEVPIHENSFGTKYVNDTRIFNWAKRNFSENFAQGVVDGLDTKVKEAKESRKSIERNISPSARRYRLAGFDLGQQARKLIGKC